MHTPEQISILTQKKKEKSNRNKKKEKKKNNKEEEEKTTKQKTKTELIRSNIFIVVHVIVCTATSSYSRNTEGCVE